jgi:hypothetical protein
MERVGRRSSRYSQLTNDTNSRTHPSVIMIQSITSDTYGYLANYTFSISQAVKYRMGPFSPMYVLELDDLR